MRSPGDGSRVAPSYILFPRRMIHGPQLFPAKEAKAVKQARAVDPALIDEIIEVASATNYGQETTPEQVRVGTA